MMFVSCDAWDVFRWVSCPLFILSSERMENGSVGNRITEIATAAAADESVEFVNAETSGTRRNMVVRVYIDKPGGVTVDDCANVSRRMEAVLDADDFIPTAYVLEVSSPGLERELYSEADFVKFAGQRQR